LIEGNAKFAIADFDKSISLDDRNPLVYAERGLAHQSQGQAGEAQKDFERGLKLNNDLRLMLDLHLLDLQMQIKEMRRRQAAIQRNIAHLTLDSLTDAELPRPAPSAV
jgi:tetratricopeptide (TPR) repeat protein